jgi:hypothetical protein
MSLEMAHKVILPPKKNYIPQFLKQRDINSYFVAILQVTEEKCRILVWIRIKTSWIQNTVRNECKGVIWDPDPDKEELDLEK